MSVFFLARLGVVQSLPGLSCKDIKDSNEDSAIGEYWIDPTHSNNAFAVFCDMQTDGGNYCILVDERVTESLFPRAFSATGKRDEKPWKRGWVRGTFCVVYSA